MQNKAKHNKTLPDFSKMTLDQIAHFWDTHDSTDYIDEMEDVAVSFKRPANQCVAVRFSTQDVSALRKVASQQGLGHTTLIRSWVLEKLHRE